MHITYRCPQCETSARAEVADGAPIACGHCGHEIQPPGGAMKDGQLRRCLVCPSTELFIRKNFPQRLGVTIVVLGFAASCVTWYLRLPIATFGVLFATAGVDVVLYLLMGDALQCYRCHAHYSGVEDTAAYSPFDLEIHERHRQEKIRLKETKAVNGSAV